MNNRLLLLINGWAGHNVVLDKFMVFCAKDLIYVVFAIVLAAMIYLAYKRQWREISWFAGSVAISYGLLLIAAHMYVDHRPFVDHHLTVLVNHAAGKSFPSDHTTATAAMGAALIFLTRYKKLGSLILSAALLIGFARIFVGIHYPVDILGGLIVGVLGGMIAYGLRQFIDRSRKHETVEQEQQA